jgi:hypothetical protein
MSDIEQALAEALRLEPPGDYVGGYGVDADEYWVLGHVAAILATEPMQAIARDAAVGRAVARDDFDLYSGTTTRGEWRWYCRFGDGLAYGGDTPHAAIASALDHD